MTILTLLGLLFVALLLLTVAVFVGCVYANKLARRPYPVGHSLDEDG